MNFTTMKRLVFYFFTAGLVAHCTSSHQLRPHEIQKALEHHQWQQAEREIDALEDPNAQHFWQGKLALEQKKWDKAYRDFFQAKGVWEQHAQQGMALSIFLNSQKSSDLLNALGTWSETMPNHPYFKGEQGLWLDWLWVQNMRADHPHWRQALQILSAQLSRSWPQPWIEMIAWTLVQKLLDMDERALENTADHFQNPELLSLVHYIWAEKGIQPASQSDLLTWKAWGLELSQNVLTVHDPVQKPQVALLLPLTGPVRRLGQSVLDGYFQGAEVWDLKPAQDLDLWIFNTQEQSLEEIFKLLAQKKIDLILGPLDKKRSAQADELSEKYSIPMISLSIDDWHPKGRSTFRYGLSLQAEAQILAEKAHALNLHRILVLYPESMSLGQKMAEGFAQHFKAMGGSVLQRAYAQDRSRDGQWVKKLIPLSFDSLLIIDRPERSARIASFLAQQNIWPKGMNLPATPHEQARQVVYLGTSLWDRPDFKTRFGKNFKGGFYIQRYRMTPDQGPRQMFMDYFQSLYGRKPYLYEAMAYDLMRLAHLLLIERGFKGSKLVEALTEIEFQGVSGKISFDAQREAHPAFYLEPL